MYDFGTITNNLHSFSFCLIANGEQGSKPELDRDLWSLSSFVSSATEMLGDFREIVSSSYVQMSHL